MATKKLNEAIANLQYQTLPSYLNDEHWAVVCAVSGSDFSSIATRPVKAGEDEAKAWSWLHQNGITKRIMVLDLSKPLKPQLEELKRRLERKQVLNA